MSKKVTSTKTVETAVVAKVEEVNVGTGKYNVTAAQKRQLNILISDIANNIPANASDDVITKMRNRLGDLILMASGHLPFDQGIEITRVKVTENAGAKLVTAFFFADVINMRVAKKCLRDSLGLDHDPHCMTIGGDKNNTMRRLSVRDVTHEAAQQVFAANKHIFSQLSFNDTDRTSSGQKEPVTQPSRKVQSEAMLEDVPEEVPQDIEVEDILEAPITEVTPEATEEIEVEDPVLEA
jgi:hypothetical protein